MARYYRDRALDASPGDCRFIATLILHLQQAAWPWFGFIYEWARQDLRAPDGVDLTLPRRREGLASPLQRAFRRSWCSGWLCRLLVFVARWSWLGPVRALLRFFLRYLGPADVLPAEFLDVFVEHLQCSRKAFLRAECPSPQERELLLGLAEVLECFRVELLNVDVVPRFRPALRELYVELEEFRAICVALGAGGRLARRAARIAAGARRDGTWTFDRVTTVAAADAIDRAVYESRLAGRAARLKDLAWVGFCRRRRCGGGLGYRPGHGSRGARISHGARSPGGEEDAADASSPPAHHGIIARVRAWFLGLWSFARLTLRALVDRDRTRVRGTFVGRWRIAQQLSTLWRRMP